MLQAIGDQIWIEDYPCEFFGVVLGRRMTVIRLTDGSLFLHSPGEMTDDRKQCLESLGRVGYIVAPARFHDLFLDGAIESFPSSELHAIRPVFSRFSSRPKTFLLSGQAVSWGGQKSIITIFRPVHFTARRCSFTGRATVASSCRPLFLSVRSDSDDTACGPGSWRLQPFRSHPGYPLLDDGLPPGTSRLDRKGSQMAVYKNHSGAREDCSRERTRGFSRSFSMGMMRNRGNEIRTIPRKEGVMDDLRIPRMPFILPAIEAETLKTGFRMVGERMIGPWEVFLVSSNSDHRGRILDERVVALSFSQK